MSSGPGAGADSGSFSSELLFAEFRSVHVRWPGRTDSQIQEEIDTCFGYQVEMRPFFDSKGQEALRGAPENRRNVRSMQKKYCTRVLAEGVNMEHRSKPQGYSGEEVGTKDGWTMLLFLLSQLLSFSREKNEIGAWIHPYLGVKLTL